MVRQGDTTFQGQAALLPAPVIKDTGWTANTTGSFSVTGIGFAPSAVQCSAIDNAVAHGFSLGTYDGTNQRLIFTTTGGVFSHSDSFLINCDQGANVSRATATSLDSDGFTVNRAVVGTPTGTVYVKALCFK